MSHERTSSASFRDHPLRGIQSAFQGLTPEIVVFMYHKGWLDNTAVADALSQGEALHPDQLTLAGLQITIEAARVLANSAGYKPMGRMILGGALDVLDGSLARCLGLVSPEGAVKDALADRIAELYMAQLIADTKSKYEEDGADSSELKMAFQLSTLTKAASEMIGVRTSEGGQGSMIERRKRLLFILHKLGKINSSTKLSDSSRSKILFEVDGLTNSLISSSREGATKRIYQILAAPPFVHHQWNNPLLYYPTSSAAIEARKYAVVVRMNQREGLDIVSYLNNLADREMFPSWEDLSQRYGYVDECIKNTEPFLEAALSFIHPSR